MSILSDGDVRTLAAAIIKGSPERCLAEEDVVKFITWCTEARARGNLVDLLLAGRVSVRPDGDDYVWHVAEEERGQSDSPRSSARDGLAYNHRRAL